MTDPAIEAAQQATADLLPLARLDAKPWAVSGAREALKPVRKQHRYLTETASDLDNQAFAAGMRAVLSDLAPLIYSAEELER